LKEGLVTTLLRQLWLAGGTPMARQLRLAGGTLIALPGLERSDVIPLIYGTDYNPGETLIGKAYVLQFVMTTFPPGKG